MEQMIETLDSIYSELDTDDIMFSTLEETVEYNKKMHIERFSKNELVNKLNSKEIKFSCCDYREVEIQENSIVLCYAPYRKTDILQDKFSHKSYFNWLDNLADNNKNIVMLVLSYEHPGNKYEVYKVVEQEASNKKLKLYINSNAGLSEVNNVSCSDF
jgi:hypothetical protein